MQAEALAAACRRRSPSLLYWIPAFPVLERRQDPRIKASAVLQVGSERRPQTPGITTMNVLNVRASISRLTGTPARGGVGGWGGASPRAMFDVLSKSGRRRLLSGHVGGGVNDRRRERRRSIIINKIEPLSTNGIYQHERSVIEPPPPPPPRSSLLMLCQILIPSLVSV